MAEVSLEMEEGTPHRRRRAQDVDYSAQCDEDRASGESSPASFGGCSSPEGEEEEDEEKRDDEVEMDQSVYRRVNKTGDGEECNICGAITGDVTHTRLGRGVCNACRSFFHLNRDKNFDCRFDDACYKDKKQFLTCRACRMHASLLAGLRLEKKFEGRARPRQSVMKDCAVCGDKVVARRFGTMTCSSCATFFKNIVDTNSTDRIAKCSFDGCCNIDKNNRYNCSYCRYTLCLMAGLDPEVVKRSTDVRCSVCEDDSIKFIRMTYGAKCCVACKKFFRVTCINKRKYECAGKKDCKVLKPGCSACRWAKCLSVGMNPRLVGCMSITRDNQSKEYLRARFPKDDDSEGVQGNAKKLPSTTTSVHASSLLPHTASTMRVRDSSRTQSTSKDQSTNQVTPNASTALRSATKRPARVVVVVRSAAQQPAPPAAASPQEPAEVAAKRARCRKSCLVCHAKITKLLVSAPDVCQSCVGFFLNSCKKGLQFTCQGLCLFNEGPSVTQCPACHMAACTRAGLDQLLWPSFNGVQNERAVKKEVIEEDDDEDVVEKAEFEPVQPEGSVSIDSLLLTTLKNEQQEEEEDKGEEAREGEVEGAAQAGFDGGRVEERTVAAKKEEREMDGETQKAAAFHAKIDAALAAVPRKIRHRAMNFLLDVASGEMIRRFGGIEPE